MRNIRFNGTQPAPFLARGLLTPRCSSLFQTGTARKQAATETNTKKYMQNYCKTIGALAAASALVAGNASAEVEYTLGTGYTSEYIFRGENLGGDLVEASASATTEWNGFGWTAGAWYGSYDGNNGRPDEGDVDELDLFAEVSKDLGFATAAVGYIYYMNEPYDLDDFQEVYVKFSRDLGFANAYAAYYWNLEGTADNYFGDYSEIGLSRGFELNQCLTLNLATNIGYMWADDQDTSWTTKASLDWGFAESAKLSPFVALAVQLTDDDDNYTGGHDNELVGGCMLSTSF
jgi:hypothetical protein